MRSISPRTRVAALCLVAALTCSSPLAAQEAASTPSEEVEIVVEGQRVRDDAIERYVEGLNAARRSLPLARYAPRDYCPAVLGLSAARNKQIAARMRTVAAAAGVKPADEGCVPSAIAIFTNDKEAFLEKFRERHPRYFQQLPARGRRLAQSDGPAVAWRIVETSATNSPTGGNLILSAYTPAVAMSVVVLERKALLGLTVTQIADYVLMQTLTDHGSEPLAVPMDFTILGALHAPVGSAVPSSLTAWDLAYLKGRYSGHPGRYSTMQAATIRGMMRRALTETAED